MKRLNFILVIGLLAVFPVFVNAQQQVQLPSVEIRVGADKVPPVVKDAFLKDFGPDHKPIVWATSQSKFNTWGWEHSTNVANQEVYDYIIHTKTSKGSELDAVYTPDGKLIRSREDVRNFVPPKAILASLQNSDYKNWKITKNVHVIKVNEGGKSKEHYQIQLQKGKDKKSVYFDKDGNMFMNKRSM